MNTHSHIQEFVMSRLALHGDFTPLADEDPLFSSARLDSLDAVELVMFLESAFAMDFARLGFDLTRLDSVSAIVDQASAPSNQA